MSQANQWNAELYDEKMNFVSYYGRGLIEWLQPVSGERILDLGCGTGDLTAQLEKAGATVTGMDYSSEMIESTRIKYPHLPFLVADAHSYRTDEIYDAVFSNAALHWMTRPAEVVRSVWLALAPGGRFVAEFGGKDNCQRVVDAIGTVLAKNGLSAQERFPWYFPSIGEYSTLLEAQGFRVTLASHFDRPTRMPDGDLGLRHWLNSFGDSFFAGMSAEEKDEVCAKVTELLRPALFDEDGWIVDYKRIRVIAYK